MVCFVNREELSGMIDPVAVERYLKEQGWTQFKTKRDDIAIFQYAKDDQFEQVTIPLDRTLSDYSMAMYDMVKTIANFEKKPIEQVLFAFMGPNHGSNFCMGEGTSV